MEGRVSQHASWYHHGTPQQYTAVMGFSGCAAIRYTFFRQLPYTAALPMHWPPCHCYGTARQQCTTAVDNHQLSWAAESLPWAMAALPMALMYVLLDGSHGNAMGFHAPS